MKKLWILAACTTMTACTHPLPSTQISELDDTRAMIEKSKQAGAETCGPAIELQAKAVATMYHAAHEITDEPGYHADETSGLVSRSYQLAKQAYDVTQESCNKPKPVVKAPEPKPVVMPVVAAPAPVVVAKPAPTPVPVVVAKPVVLEVISLQGVYFETNSSQLTEASSTSLDAAVRTLKKRPDIRVEIAAYSDSRGKDAYNLALSKKRARSVLDYLVSHGAVASRLNAQGYGEANPVADNNTAEGRAKNRRVELHVLSK